MSESDKTNKKSKNTAPRAKPKNKLVAIILVIFAVLYGLSPIDIIPDYLFPLLGFGDDAALLGYAIIYFWKAFIGGGGVQDPATEDSKKVDEDVIDV
jgi:uncharacterized membrane protein YkvA (DUF1232 family)